MTWEDEDYSSFSQEAIQKALADIVADVKKKTGASDKELNIAFALAANKIMNINCLALPAGPTEKDKP